MDRDEPVVLVEWEPPQDTRDSGYAFVCRDAAAVEPELLPDAAVRLGCLGCVVRRWPDVAAAGMAVARLHGGARLDPDGVWHPDV
jgi:hypothetical protein